MKYYEQKDGEWVAPKIGFKVACCDCGLVHRIEFRIVNGQVEFRAWRDNGATAMRRRTTKAKALNKATVGGAA